MEDSNKPPDENTRAFLGGTPDTTPATGTDIVIPTKASRFMTPGQQIPLDCMARNRGRRHRADNKRQLGRLPSKQKNKYRLAGAR